MKKAITGKAVFHTPVRFTVDSLRGATVRWRDRRTNGHQNGHQWVTTGRDRTGLNGTSGRISQYNSTLIRTEQNGSDRPSTNFESGASTNSATGGARLSVNGPIPLPLRIAIWAQAAGRRGRSSGPPGKWYGFFSEPKLRSGRRCASRIAIVARC